MTNLTIPRTGRSLCPQPLQDVKVAIPIGIGTGLCIPRARMSLYPEPL